MNNTKTVKQAFEDFKTGNITGILNSLDENVVWINPDASEIPFSISVKGRENVGGFFKKLSDTTDITRFEMNDFVEQGNRVVSWGSFDATVRSTGKKFTTPLIITWEFNNEGKCSKYQAHANTLAQLKAFN
jgi:ketosteroid isomerase-like protein